MNKDGKIAVGRYADYHDETVQALRIPAVPAALVRRLKMQALEAGKTLQQYVTELLEKAVRK